MNESIFMNPGVTSPAILLSNAVIMHCMLMTVEPQWTEHNDQAAQTVKITQHSSSH